MKKSCVHLVIASSLLLVPGLAFSQSAGVTVDHLRCEHLEDPLGIDAVRPRLGWLASSPRRGEKQRAYEIIVASSREKLDHDQGNLWDSGRVVSSDNEAVFDKPTVSRQECYWKVRVWGDDEKPGAWSQPAHWEMGLLKPEDWKAQWLNAPVTSKEQHEGTLTILQASYEAVDGSATRDVTGLVVGKLKDNTLNLQVGNDTLGGDSAMMHAKQLRVSYLLGKEKKEAVVPEGGVMALPAVMSLPYLRKAFTLSKPVAKARLYVTALGIYEVHLNGKRVGDAAFAPGWTDYNKRVQYQEYDVTTLLNKGGNALGALTVNGWYCGHLGNGGFQQYGTVPAFLAQLEVTYADGSSETIATDETWKICAGPVVEADFMEGESVNETMEIPGWDAPGLDDRAWGPVLVREEKRNLVPQIDPPVRQVGELHPREISEPVPGHWVFDLGQNMVGVARIHFSATAGSHVTVRYAEMLNPDKTIYTANLRSARSTDTYFCTGAGVKEWQPQFTFHGFRYVELTGLPQGEKPGMDAVTGIVLGSDIPRIGEFACSDPRINQLYSNIWWGQRGNYLSVPTDCPQRNERLGWMGDAEVFVPTATCNANVDAFFTKWLRDVDDSQHADGAFTDVSPYRGAGWGTPGWSDAGVICPWAIYQAYGDKRLLEEHLPAMTKFVEWGRAHSDGLIRDKDLGHNYGDWLAPMQTPHDLIGTAFFANAAHLLAKSYAAVGQQEQAAKYEKLFEDIKTAFNSHYVKPDGHMEGDSQCGYAMALKFDLLPENLRGAVVQLLADDVKARGNHISTGFLGVGNILPALTQGGKTDTAYALLMQDTYPSWLFSVKHGATTIWERWDGWTPEKGFQDAGMNSFNHYSLGSCGEWLYSTVAGIAPDPKAPGYANVIIHPQPGGGLTWAKGSILTAHGLVKTSWAIVNHTFSLDCTVPMNSTATVILPSEPDKVSEGNVPVSKVKGIHLENNVTHDETILSVGSGSYHFTCAQG